MLLAKRDTFMTGLRPLRQASLAEVPMLQPYPSSSQRAAPDRPPAPASVLAAVKLMYAGAAISAISVITVLALIPAVKAALRTASPSLTAAQVRDVNVLLTLGVVFGLVPVILWLWMARANGRGRNWARIASTVLFGLATLELIRARLYYRGGYLAHFDVGGHTYSVIHSVFGATVLGVIVPVLLWLTGLAAVWLLWRPASRAFFKPQGFVRAQHGL
jgi:hypothetical protein